MLTKACSESAISKTRVYKWYKSFQDDERPERTSTLTTDKNMEKVEEMVINHQRTKLDTNSLIQFFRTNENRRAHKTRLTLEAATDKVNNDILRGHTLLYVSPLIIQETVGTFKTKLGGKKPRQKPSDKKAEEKKHPRGEEGGEGVDAEGLGEGFGGACAASGTGAPRPPAAPPCALEEDEEAKRTHPISDRLHVHLFAHRGRCIRRPRVQDREPTQSGPPRYVRNIRNKTQKIQTIVRRKYNITEEDFRIMETVVLKSEPHRAGQQWKFTGAFYYATTVLTTIGYGHSTPSTISGKLFTMCYAMIGIPLGLVMFQSIGERVNRLSSVIIRSVKSSLNCRQTTASELDLICVVTFLSSLTIAGGAAAFSRYEGWTYFDSVYYCFITLTTIGFGDMLVSDEIGLLSKHFHWERVVECRLVVSSVSLTLQAQVQDAGFKCCCCSQVALQKDNALSKKPEYVMFALIFILFGLAIVAASLNLLVLRFVTMNTEDERRDEAQAMQALAGAVRLEGDVITANGSILSGQLGHHVTETTSLDIDDASVCSCPCGCIPTNTRHRFTVRRSPTQIRHLLPVLPMHELHLPQGPLVPVPVICPNHRASI
ncbi:unnamed protein product [Brassicogethes aeneus]|uniref:Potassium channel domain-containing protein n=1 Tax=Brassicogethes aeneus TaxID=1431903 RepID=A0A9P0AUK1_BRAAE|nr:unnamed protein product [Brassicogethes aeneus]